MAGTAAWPLRTQGQGCSQCRDNVAQANPDVQAGYHEGILVLLGAASVVSASAIVLIRRMR